MARYGVDLTTLSGSIDGKGVGGGEAYNPIVAKDAASVQGAPTCNSEVLNAGGCTGRYAVG